jgi:nitrite reductase/ring-hydroxylating ferredoxin subunit
MFSFHKWHKLEGISFASLAEREIKQISIEGKEVAIVRANNKVFATAAHCPHAGAPLCNGWLDAQGRVVCPQHYYRFDPANGRNTSGEGYKLVTYPVKIKNDDIFIGLA